MGRDLYSLAKCRVPARQVQGGAVREAKMSFPSVALTQSIFKIPVRAPASMGVMQVPAGPDPPAPPGAAVDYSKWILYGGLALAGIMLLGSIGGRGGGRRR